MADLLALIYQSTGLADTLAILFLFLVSLAFSVVEGRWVRGSHRIPALVLCCGPLIFGLWSSFRTWRYLQRWTAAGEMSPEDLAEVWRMAPVPALFGAALTAVAGLFRLALGRFGQREGPTAG